MNLGVGRRLVAVLVGAAFMASGGLGLAACSSGDSGGVELEPASDNPSTATTASLTGSWEGSFDCGGRSTGLTLTVDDRGSGRVAANFAYHPADTPLGPTTPRYSMEGEVRAGQLVLTGLEWIHEGGDQAMIGLQAQVAGRTDPDRLEGTVDGDGCTTFAIDRTSTDPWYVGRFEGVYGCGQGVTGLTLTVEDRGEGAVRATYEFYEVPENPGVASGSYRMEGTYDQGEMRLHGVEWIDQPTNYVMVDLQIENDLGIDPERLYGVVGVSGGGENNCTLFSLDRVAA